MSIIHAIIKAQKKTPGFFSDETNGKTILEFVALGAKSYAYSLDEKEEIKAKDIQRHVIKNHMTLWDNKRYLFSEEGFQPLRKYFYKIV